MRIFLIFFLLISIHGHSQNWITLFDTPNGNMKTLILAENNSTIIAISGYSSPAIILKLTAQGDTLWSKRLPFDTFEIDFNATSAPEDNFQVLQYDPLDSGFVVVSGESWIGIRKYDKNGNILWHKSWVDPGGFGGISNVYQTRDSGFILLVHQGIITMSNVHNYSTIIKLNHNGDTLWTKTSIWSSSLMDVYENQDKSLIFLEHNGIINTDSTGNITSCYYINVNFMKMLHSQTGNIFAFGFDSNLDGAIINYDTSGIILNAVKIPDFKIYDAVFSYDSSILVLGSKYPYEDTITLVQFDQNLNYISEFIYVYPGLFNHFLPTVQSSRCGLIQTKDSSLIIASDCNANFGASQNTLVFKTDQVFYNNCVSANPQIQTIVTPYNLTITNNNFIQNNHIITYGNIVLADSSGINYITPCLNLNIEKIDNNISLYPNPGSNEIHLDATFNLNNSIINVISSDGRIVGRNEIKTNSNQYILNTEKYPDGIYSVLIQCKDESEMRLKFVVIH